MSDGLNLYLGDDGVARCYDDTYDITIHCESEEDQRKVIECLESRQWIPCSERLPELDEDGYSDKVLLCFENYPGVEICEYRVLDGVGAWYDGDTDDSPEDLGIRPLALDAAARTVQGG